MKTPPDGQGIGTTRDGRLWHPECGQGGGGRRGERGQVRKGLTGGQTAARGVVCHGVRVFCLRGERNAF